MPGGRRRLAGCDVLLSRRGALWRARRRRMRCVAVNVTGTSSRCWTRARGPVCGGWSTPAPSARWGDPPATDELPDEDTPFNLWNSASHYVRSKYLGELAARGWAEAGLERGDRQTGRARGRWRCAADRDRHAHFGRARGSGRRPTRPAGSTMSPVRDIALGPPVGSRSAVCRGRTYILGHRDGNLTEAAFHKMLARLLDTTPIRPAPKRAAAERNLQWR